MNKTVKVIGISLLAVIGTIKLINVSLERKLKKDFASIHFNSDYNPQTQHNKKYKVVKHQNVSFDIPNDWSSSYEVNGTYNQIYCSDASDDNYFLIIWSDVIEDKNDFLNGMKENFQQQEPFNKLKFNYYGNDTLQSYKAISYNINGSHLNKTYLGKMSVFTAGNKQYFYSYLSNLYDYHSIGYPRIFSSINLENQYTTNSTIQTPTKSSSSSIKKFSNNDLSLSLIHI